MFAVEMEKERVIEKEKFSDKVQRYGSYLSGMILPNIGAFIAWGLITALFLETGWTPNEKIAVLITPMINYLLPLLIGYTGGKVVYDTRGAVVGAIATMGVIVGSDIPMFLGAMIMGPLGGFVIKKFDQLIEGKVRHGFEMLVNNFSAGILGRALTVFALFVIGPVVNSITTFLSEGVQLIINTGLLPLISIFIEPAKVLFLNNAVDHGVLAPIGIEQAATAGKSILFLLVTNPGPGLGILLAYMLYGKGMAKSSAPGSIIIHFFGGIHEVYFPYILMKPILIIATILGGASGILTFMLFGAGLVAVPSPGSIFALTAMTPKGDLLGILSGVLIATFVSFAISAFVLKRDKSTENEGDLEEATNKMKEMKGKKQRSSATASKDITNSVETKGTVIKTTDIKRIVFACDAGMGSSAMGASILRDKIIKAGLEIEVINTSINNIPDNADMILTQKKLTNRAKAINSTAIHLSVENYLDNERYENIVNKLKNGSFTIEEL